MASITFKAGLNACVMSAFVSDPLNTFPEVIALLCIRYEALACHHEWVVDGLTKQQVADFTHAVELHIKMHTM